ncbi:hypothetical protein HDU97_000933 [Phlyctochytrium planicorne]|nr:hypothetical protein HDU97_000933 [Phlyctochytrium planicorne]
MHIPSFTTSLLLLIATTTLVSASPETESWLQSHSCPTTLAPCIDKALATPLSDPTCLPKVTSFFDNPAGGQFPSCGCPIVAAVVECTKVECESAKEEVAGFAAGCFATTSAATLTATTTRRAVTSAPTVKNVTVTTATPAVGGKATSTNAIGKSNAAGRGFVGCGEWFAGVAVVVAAVALF